MEGSSSSNSHYQQQQHHHNQHYYYQQQHHHQQQLQQQEQMKLYQQQQEYLHHQQQHHQQQQQQLYQPYQQQQQTQLLAQGQTFVKGNIMVDQHGVYVEGSDHKFLINVKDLDIDMENIIGRGACSVVRIATHRSSGIKIALKMISIFDQSKREQIFEEIQSLYSTNCPAIISFYGAFFSDDILAIALEYMNGGSLQTVLEDVGVIPESVLANITFQILWGLAYLKHERRVHRDIKPSNILINSSGQIKLTDFGVSKELMSSIAMGQTFVGTFKYMSPERVQNKPHSYSSDIWSLGIVLIECATKKCPFDEVDSVSEIVLCVCLLNWWKLTYIHYS